MTDIEDKINAVEFLVDHYSRNFRQYQLQNYNETELRVDFVNPFFEALGWDVLNKAGLPQHMREVTHEATVLVEEKGQIKTKNQIIHLGLELNCFIILKQKNHLLILQPIKIRRFSYGGMGGVGISRFQFSLILQIYIFMTALLDRVVSKTR